MYFEICFVGRKHAIEPGKEFLGTVVTVHHDGAAIPKLMANGLEEKNKATYTPYALAMVRTWWAALTAPRMEACCLSLARPFPATYALPPCETWMMMGALMSLSM